MACKRSSAVAVIADRTALEHSVGWNSRGQLLIYSFTLSLLLTPVRLRFLADGCVLWPNDRPTSYSKSVRRSE